MEAIELVRDFLQEKGYRPVVHLSPGTRICTLGIDPVLSCTGPTGEYFHFMFRGAEFSCWVTSTTGDDVSMDRHDGNLADPRSLDQLDKFIRARWTSVRVLK